MVNIFVSIMMFFNGGYYLKDLSKTYSGKEVIHSGKESIYSAKMPIEPPEILQPLDRITLKPFPPLSPAPPINPPPVTNVNPKYHDYKRR